MLNAFCWAVAILGSLVLAGRVYQRVGTARDRRRHPPPGKLVAIDGHHLHLIEMGQGSPAVVFESGLMSTVLAWQNIQPEVAKSTRTVSYDRAGLGWSDPGPIPRDADQIACELHALLEVSRVVPPYVLVGHSFGGLTTRVFASRFPDEVAGLVLLDPVVPREWNPASEQDQQRIRTGARILRRASLISHWGVLRLTSLLLRSGPQRVAEPLIRLMSRGAPAEHGTARSPLFWNLPPRERAMAHFFWVQPKFTETIASQIENLPESAAQVGATKCLAGKPVTVISAANTPLQRRSEQIAMAQLSSAGRHITATRSNHWIMVDEPQLVLEAVGDIVDQVRRAGAQHPID